MEQRVQKKERILGLDFIRVICTLGVVWCHYFAYAKGVEEWFVYYKSGMWGSVILTMFFILSGFSQYYTAGELSWKGQGRASMKMYYYKRWKSLFPAFYIAFLFFYFLEMMKQGTPFYSQNLWMSIVGMDGYLNFLGPNYYRIGEWFLGAIILLYLFYPLLLKAFNRWTLVTSLLCFASFGILVYDMDFFGMTGYRAPVSTLVGFTAGMLLAKYPQVMKSRITLAVCSAFALAAVLFTLPIDVLFMYQLMGFAMFIVCYHVGEAVMKIRFIHSWCRSFGAISFNVYLVHHLILWELLKFRNPVSSLKSVIYFCLVMILITIAAKCLQIITDAVLGSKTFKTAESWFLKTIKA